MATQLPAYRESSRASTSSALKARLSSAVFIGLNWHPLAQLQTVVKTKYIKESTYVPDLLQSRNLSIKID